VTESTELPLTRLFALPPPRASIEAAVLTVIVAADPTALVKFTRPLAGRALAFWLAIHVPSSMSKPPVNWIFGLPLPENARVPAPVLVNLRPAEFSLMYELASVRVFPAAMSRSPLTRILKFALVKLTAALAFDVIPISGRPVPPYIFCTKGVAPPYFSTLLAEGPSKVSEAISAPLARLIVGTVLPLFSTTSSAKVGTLAGVQFDASLQFPATVLVHVIVAARPESQALNAANANASLTVNRDQLDRCGRLTRRKSCPPARWIAACERNMGNPPR